jgi:hypothetical protein
MRPLSISGCIICQSAASQPISSSFLASATEGVSASGSLMGFQGAQAMTIMAAAGCCSKNETAPAPN